MDLQPFPLSTATAKRKGPSNGSPEPQHANLLPWPKRHQTMSEAAGQAQQPLPLAPISFPRRQDFAASSSSLPPIQRHHSSAGVLSPGVAFNNNLSSTASRPPLRRLTSLPRLRHQQPPPLAPVHPRQPRSATTSIGPHFSRESAMRSTCASSGEASFSFFFPPKGGSVDDTQLKWRGPMLPPISPGFARQQHEAIQSNGYPFTAPPTSHGFGAVSDVSTRHRSLSTCSQVASSFAGLALKDVAPRCPPTLSGSSSNSSLATSAQTIPTPALSMGGVTDDEMDAYGVDDDDDDDDELLGSDYEQGELLLDAAAGPTAVAPSPLPPHLFRPALDSSVLSGLSSRLQSAIRLHRRLKHFISTAHHSLPFVFASDSPETAPLLTTRLDSDDHSREPLFQLSTFRRPTSQADDGGATRRGAIQIYDIAIHRALCFGEIVADAVTMTTPRTTAAAANGTPLHAAMSQGGGGGGGAVQSLQIACIRLGDRYWITSTDICRLLRFRLVAIGWEVLDQTKLFEGVYSDLRTVSKASIRLELPCSPLVASLFELGCVATLKAQKLYEWTAVEHDALLLEAMQRSLDRARRGEDKLACRPGNEGFKLQGGDAGRPLPRQLGITRHTAQASTVVASPSRSLTPAGLARLVLGSDPLYRLSHASDASLTLGGRVSVAQASTTTTSNSGATIASPSVPFPALDENDENDVPQQQQQQLSLSPTAQTTPANRPRRRLTPRRLDTKAFSTLPFLR